LSESIIISKYDETYCHIRGDESVLYELVERFTFTIANAQHHPKVKARSWDGKIRLFSARTGLLYFGLHPYVAEYCEKNGYECTYEDGLDCETEFSVVEFQKMIDALKLSSMVDGERTEIKPHDYQERAVIHAIQSNRSLLLSPTSSGKSLLIYCLMRYYLAKTKGKILIVVPTTTLVRQMYDDFGDYARSVSWNAEEHCHQIYDGGEKETDKRVVITTWQALATKERLPKELRARMNKAQIKLWNKKAKYILDQEYFDQFSAVFGDECLHPDTQITMGDLSVKALVNIVPGDEVMTFNETMNRFEAKPVVKQHCNLTQTSEVFRLTFENGTSMEITGNHKVLLKSGSWKRVDALVENDDVLNISNEQMSLHGESSTIIDTTVL
jgi:hypothetical protein